MERRTAVLVQQQKRTLNALTCSKWCVMSVASTVFTIAARACRRAHGYNVSETHAAYRSNAHAHNQRLTHIVKLLGVER